MKAGNPWTGARVCGEMWRGGIGWVIKAFWSLVNAVCTSNSSNSGISSGNSSGNNSISSGNSSISNSKSQ